MQVSFGPVAETAPVCLQATPDFTFTAVANPIPHPVTMLLLFPFTVGVGHTDSASRLFSSSTTSPRFGAPRLNFAERGEFRHVDVP